MKLDRFLAKQDSMGRTKAHLAIAAGRVSVDGTVMKNGQIEVSRFSLIELDGAVLQTPQRALYLMMNKPVGYLSATMDAEHPTVLDLIDDPEKGTLHIAGRLDRGSSGLLLLTNDGRWSKQLMHPDEKVAKTYLVTTAEPIAAGAEAAFAEGFYFHTENITTLPAVLVRIGECAAKVTICEGRYHQVKRMFHRIGNRVTALHRLSIGGLTLPVDLAAGQWRALTPEECRLAIS